MKSIACITTPCVTLGKTKGQYPGYASGTLVFETIEELEGVITDDLWTVIGDLKNLPRDGYTSQGEHIFNVTDEQVAALRALGKQHIADQQARQAKEDAITFYSDINDMLRKNGNAAAAE